MRKRIRQIARGRFEYDQPSLSLPEEELSLTVILGQEYTGSFEITSTNHIPVRGVVYSTNPRMECLTPQFEGETVRIRYQFNSRGLQEGQSVKGEFVIVCNQSEHSLPFCVSVSKLYAQTSAGQIRSLHDFTNLAREHWDEAYKLFYHKSFSNVISPKETRESMLYRGILGAKPSPQNMEEFLVGIGQKKQIHFTISQSSLDVLELTETLQQEVSVRKDEWGYFAVAIHADSDFIRLPDTTITTEDFLGSTYTCKYLLDYDRMHAGNNAGRIFFTSVYETKILEITAHKGERVKRDPKRIQIKEYRAGLVELYQAYRLKKIVTGVWANETIEILNHLHALVPENMLYVLMKAQAFIINRQRQEAEWILNEFKRSWMDKKDPLWGYYLYLMTLLEREPSYVDRMTREIELIFRENPDSALLFWVLSFLEEEYYNNSAHKLDAIAGWVMDGCTSPYLYLEAYYLYCQEPYLLTRLGKFEVRILRWAIHRHSLTRELAEQIFQVVEVNKGFQQVRYELLCAAYEVAPDPENVGLICSYLIRAQKFEVKYHHWFEMGIELELRITSLYEAYLLSLDERAVGTVPKIIQMYFQYDSSLPYRKMAILYCNIITAKDTCPEMYEKYLKTMSRFAMEQVEQEHMDDNLAVLYEDMLDLGLVNEEIAHCLAGILYTHKLIIFDRRMVRAIIYQRQMKEAQIVPIVDQSAYFQLFSKDYVILFEDEKGRRYISSVSYRLEKLMEPDRYLAKCMPLAADELNYLIPYFENKSDYRVFAKEDEPYFSRILYGAELTPSFQTELALEIMRYYQSAKEDDHVKEYLTRVDFAVMSQPTRQYFLELLVRYRMYDRAYELLQTYGMDQISYTAKAALCCYMIEARQEEKDEYLLMLAADTFAGKKYNDRILRYLCDFYEGPTDMMLRLWRAAGEFAVPTFELEERILIQMIYADRPLGPAEELFAHYYENGGREMVVLAYLTTCAHNYFVRETFISSDVLFVIRDRYQHHLELNDACKLALLKSFSESEDQERFLAMEDALLSEYTCRNMNFAFYKKLDRRLVLKYHLEDKVFLEYRTDPRKHVVLHYSRDEDGNEFHREDMPDVYDGIFVEQFVLFFGDVVQYYITEEFGNQVEVKVSNRLTSNTVWSDKDNSRFNLLNQMMILDTLADYTPLIQTMEKYEKLDEVTRKAFHLL